MSERSRLRGDLRERRRAIPAAERIAAANALATRLLALPFAPTSGPVAGYWALDGEIALHAWQLQLPPGVVYCLPVLCDDVLQFAPWQPGGALKANRFGIPEPDLPSRSLLAADAMAMVALPVVGFDRRGQRLGMGGGWYDRTFAFRSASAAPPWLVGAAFSVQEVAMLPAQPWDIGLDAICSERETCFACLPDDRTFA